MSSCIDGQHRPSVSPAPNSRTPPTRTAPQPTASTSRPDSPFGPPRAITRNRRNEEPAIPLQTLECITPHSLEIPPANLAPTASASSRHSYDAAAPVTAEPAATAAAATAPAATRAAPERLPIGQSIKTALSSRLVMSIGTVLQALGAVTLIFAGAQEGRKPVFDKTGHPNNLVAPSGKQAGLIIGGATLAVTTVVSALITLRTRATRLFSRNEP